ncbi:MAG: polysaccharide deacetylase family protein [Cytophagales bacterium]|nr:polysaccharide deacetylase family protein [Cytophagales bacterium]
MPKNESRKVSGLYGAGTSECHYIAGKLFGQMLMRITVLIALLFAFRISFSQTGEICITFDDLPAVTYDFKGIEFKQQLIGKLIKTFDVHKIQAIGFVNESRLYEGGTLVDERVALLRMWLDGGYELGNHTYAHKDYHKVSFNEFTGDILNGEQVCRDLVKEYGQEYRYFRHPFLHIGPDKEKHDALKSFLNDHNYIEAPVSIDNDDYMFAYAYSKARTQDNKALMAKIGNAYVDYMEKKLLFFEGQSRKLLGRNIKHILLLHANLIDADYLDELARRYRDHGYRFISMREALEDDAYQMQITTYGNWGISWIDRWALSAGKKGDFFKGDPLVPDYVKAALDNQ